MLKMYIIVPFKPLKVDYMGSKINFIEVSNDSEEEGEGAESGEVSKEGEGSKDGEGSDQDTYDLVQDYFGFGNETMTENQEQLRAAFEEQNNNVEEEGADDEEAKSQTMSSPMLSVE